MKAPFPWFGGKSRAAHLVWERFGDPINYVEPFAGSLAVLLLRPLEESGRDHWIESVNDVDCYLANFWRALRNDPEAVAGWADWPVNETDLHSRHTWLVNNREFQQRMDADPEYFDVKVAGWWVWGISQWIGSGWCVRPEWRGRTNAARAERGVWRKRPWMKRGGTGVHRTKPDLSGDGSSGRGIHAPSLAIAEYMQALSERLRRVRVCCGDWSRIVTPSCTDKIGVTGVFLDPPYSAEAGRDPDLYTQDDLQLAHAVAKWAIENGDNPKLRIALCGYEGEHRMPASWECVPWKANGGYGNQSAGRGKANAVRERIWFSPHCLKPENTRTLFDALPRGHRESVKEEVVL